MIELWPIKADNKSALVYLVSCLSKVKLRSHILYYLKRTWSRKPVVSFNHAIKDQCNQHKSNSQLCSQIKLLNKFCQVIQLISLYNII